MLEPECEKPKVSEVAEYIRSIKLAGNAYALHNTRKISDEMIEVLECYVVEVMLNPGTSKVLYNALIEQRLVEFIKQECSGGSVFLEELQIDPNDIDFDLASFIVNKVFVFVTGCGW